MSNTISSLAQTLRALVSLILLGLIGTGGWMAYREYDRQAQLDRQLKEATAEVERLTAANEKLNLAVRLLKVDHRVAEVKVLEQTPGPGHGTTRFQFVELAADGSPVDGPKVF